MKERVKPLIEYIAESTTACLVTMVQGNILALTLGHLVVASQTGVIAGVCAAGALYLARTDKRWLVSIVLGTATGIVDFYIHPGNFGSAASEAIVTGIGAAILSYLMGYILTRFRRDAVTADEPG